MTTQKQQSINLDNNLSAIAELALSNRLSKGDTGNNMHTMPENETKVLNHYNDMARELVETHLRNLTDVEIVRFCQREDLNNPVIDELTHRLNRYINLFKGAIKEQNK